jgi:glyoxylase-like metal-dependent hydrolase (beta-lactamase superfamily II)
VLDTGINNAATRAAWDALVDGPLKGRKLTRLIVSHFHPDHIGLAGWLCERFSMPMWTSQTSYLSSANISLQPGALDAPTYRDFYLNHGLSEETTKLVATQGHGYLRMVAPLPPTFTRMVTGDHILIGGRRFDVLTGDGHAPEQVMLYCAEDRLFFVADQVLAKITPNISVWAVDPDGDPLGLYLRSLSGLRRDIPEDVLVLPGAPIAVLRAAPARACAGRASSRTLRIDRRGGAQGAHVGGGAGARAVPSAARSASDELRVLGSSGACQLHARPGRAGVERRQGRAAGDDRIEAKGGGSRIRAASRVVHWKASLAFRRRSDGASLSRRI